MCQNKYDISCEDLNPTFLFTLKGKRLRDENNYHCHDFIEFDFILSGSGKYRINKNIYSVSAGDVIILNPGDYHQAMVTPNTEPMMEFFIGFSDVHFQNMPKNHITFSDNSSIFHTGTELRQHLMKLCYSVSAENDACHPGRYFMLKSYLIQILTLIIREQTIPMKLTKKELTKTETTKKSHVVQQIVTYFSEHYNEKISLDQIAKNMYLSPFYISKIFKDETGDTPINYLIRIRMDKAKDILETTESPSIQKVASCVGYEDAYHFSKLFKKYHGVAPSKIKQDSNC